MIIETLVFTLQPLKALDNISWITHNYEEQISTFYSLNDVLTFMMLSRTPLIIQVFLHSLNYSTLQMREILQNNNLEENVIFILKCLLKKSPYFFFSISLLISIFFFTYCLRIFELPLAIKLEQESFQSYLTTLWVVMITMTTVGYGDYNPKTIPGRLIGFILCIAGVFLMSLIVIILFQSLELTFEEKQALLIFNKLEAKKPLQQNAASLIKELWKL